MKSFNEWLKEKNAIEENIADYTPEFIRTPLQNMGLMGRTTAGQKVRDELDAQDERLAADERRKAKMTRQNQPRATQQQTRPSYQQTPQPQQTQQTRYDFRRDGFSDHHTVPKSQSSHTKGLEFNRDIQQAELDAMRETNLTRKRKLQDKVEELIRQRDAWRAAIDKAHG
jgi:hypothetical protein